MIIDVTEPSTSGNTEQCSSQDTDDMFSSSSQDSIPEQDVSLWSDEVQEQSKKRETLNTAIKSLTSGRMSPILSTLNTSWDDISTTQKKYYQRKAQESIMASLSVISPGQEQELWNSVRKESNLDERKQKSSRRKSIDPSSPAIDSLVKAYDHADSWRTKRQILSIFANDFSRTELSKLIPSLSKWRIDQARQHAIEAGKGYSIPKEPIYRTRISAQQIHHFVDYISRPDMVQDVAFGTKTLELSSGDCITIPAVVRTMIPSRIIDQYLTYCDQQNFDAAGKRSLFRMIEVCAASLQKSLAGLDNTTAEGTDAIDNMKSMVDDLGSHGADVTWVTNTQTTIKQGKRYLKTDLRSHVGRERPCTDHCTTHALSDPGDKKFQRKCFQEHDVYCSNCQSLKDVLTSIEREIDNVSMSQEERERAKHEFKQNSDAVNAWRAHLLRTINQEEAKQDALEALDEETCLVVMDWAMKFLPHRYRERMSDFFGKRGRSWHVSAVIAKRGGKYEVECFVHIFDVCTQDSFAVASIIENLLKTIKKESPRIKAAFLRSDNAGCYHSGQLILSLPDIAKRSGINVLRYDFSDPQSGKDICDRKIATMKAHIKRWVNEKHDVLTASDMKTALESHNGVKGCRAAVVKVDVTAEDNTNKKIPGISLLNNFAFTKHGVRVWRAYNIGLGKVLSYEDLHYNTQQDTKLQVLVEFGPPCNQVSTMSRRQPTNTDIFSCCESTCVLTFRTLEDAEEHMDTGKHVKISERDSVYDSVKKRWADRVTEMNVGGLESLEIPVAQGPTTSSASNISAEGWALKSTKRSPRMGEKAKSFLLEKFNSGSTGYKADPAQVAKEMKVIRDEAGNLVFSPDEWRSAKQIASFFSRMSALQKRQQPQLQNEPDALDEEDLEALDEEISNQALHEVVLQDIDSSLHPLIVNDIDICTLRTKSKLNTLSVMQLRSICTSLNLDTPGRQNRKDTFIRPITTYASKCSCCL